MQPNRSRRRRGVATQLVACLAAVAIPSVAVADINLGTAGSVTYMSNTTGFFQEPNSFGSVTVACPGALALTGGGADAVSSGHGGAITGAFPGDDDDQDTRADDQWTVDVTNTVEGSHAEAWAFCTPGPSKLRVTTLQVGADRARAARAACPADSDVTGGGALGFLGGDLGNQRFIASHPYDDGDAGVRPDDGWRAKIYNDHSGAATMNVYALCRATEATYLSATRGLGPNVSRDQESPRCPASQHVAGAGAKLEAPERRSRIGGFMPTDSGDAGIVPDDYVVASASNISPQVAQLTAFAICTP